VQLISDKIESHRLPATTMARRRFTKSEVRQRIVYLHLIGHPAKCMGGKLQSVPPASGLLFWLCDNLIICKRMLAGLLSNKPKSAIFAIGLHQLSDHHWNAKFTLLFSTGLNCLHPRKGSRLNSVWPICLCEKVFNKTSNGCLRPDIQRKVITSFASFVIKTYSSFKKTFTTWVGEKNSSRTAKLFVILFVIDLTIL